MASPPQNVGLCLRVAPDGNLIPCDIGSSGAPGLGLGTICVVNLDPNLPIGPVIQTILATVGFTLPWARYTVDFRAAQVAASLGNKVVATTF